MAHGGHGVSPWVWILVAVLIILLAAFFASIIPEDNQVQDGSAQGAQAQQADAKILGMWQNTEDPRFSREFKADGTIVDRYEGDDSATAIGTWMAVDPKGEPPEELVAPAENLAGMTVLKLTFPDGLILYAGVNSVSETDLALVNVSGRGNILSFTKVQ